MVQSWGLIAAVGASHAPFYLLPVLCGLFYLLVLPLTTSFPVRGVKASAGKPCSLQLMQQLIQLLLSVRKACFPILVLI